MVALDADEGFKVGRVIGFDIFVEFVAMTVFSWVTATTGRVLLCEL